MAYTQPAPSFQNALGAYNKQFQGMLSNPASRPAAPTVANQPRSFADQLNSYNQTANVAMQNRASGRDANVAGRVFDAYVNAQPGGSAYDPAMVRRPGDSTPDWARPDAPKFGVYSGVYGANKNPFAPTNITADGRPAIYSGKSPYELVTGQNLAQVGQSAQEAADRQNRAEGNTGRGTVEFGSYGRDPIADLLSTPTDLTGPRGGETLQAGRTAMANARYSTRHSPWMDVPYLWQDQMNYMTARTPQNAGVTGQIQRMYDLNAMSPQERSRQVIDASSASAKAGTYGQQDSTFNLFAADPGGPETTGLEAKGLFAMGMPGSAPFAGWYDQWDETKPASYVSPTTIASSLVGQLRGAGNINRRDFGAQAPSPVPGVGPAASMFASTEPDRTGRMQQSQRRAMPAGFAAQPQRRYALQESGEGGSSSLLDELRRRGL